MKPTAIQNNTLAEAVIVDEAFRTLGTVKLTTHQIAQAQADGFERAWVILTSEQIDALGIDDYDLITIRIDEQHAA